MLNPNFPVLAGWPGKEQSLDFFFHTPVAYLEASLFIGLLSKGAALPCDLGLLLGRPPPFSGRWQATFAWLDFDLSLQTLVICEISLDCHTEWSHPISLCNQAPGRLCQTECWSGRGVLEPDFCSSQVLNLTLMESKGQGNPDQDLHTILVWMEKGKYAQWEKHSNYKITV